jgi:hypothetical protein
MITKKNYEDIALILAHYNLPTDFISELARYFKNDNKNFNNKRFKLRIESERAKIIKEVFEKAKKKELDERDKKYIAKRCPRCLKYYNSFPALSRKDNKTLICSECGVLEAMEDFIGRTEK